MIKLKRILATVDGTDFDNICSFTTKNYIGIWNHVSNCFVLFAKEDDELICTELGRCDTLDELDDAVFKECEEHIEEVSDKSEYEFKLIC